MIKAKSHARCVNLEQLHLAWPVFKEYLRANWPDHEEKVLFQALRGHYQLWMVLKGEDVNGVFITAVHNEGGNKILRLIYLAGQFQRGDFMEIKNAVIAMYEHCGADWIEGIPDFKAPRFLKSLGAQTDGSNLYWRN